MLICEKSNAEALSKLLEYIVNTIVDERTHSVGKGSRLKTHFVSANDIFSIKEKKYVHFF